jgi:hypothetical protein
LLMRVVMNTHRIRTCCRCLDASTCCSQHLMQCCKYLHRSQTLNNDTTPTL